MLLYIVIFIVALLIVAWAVAALHLKGADLSAFDRPDGERFSTGPAPSAEIKAVIASLGGVAGVLNGVPRSKRVAVLREYMDNMFADRRFDASFTPVDAGGVRAEWVQAPGTDGARRLLYIHGGAWMMGSPKSHRTLTSRLSALTGGAVLAIDYRLMPEHRRMAGVEDCRRAYRWMLDHGPAGVQQPAQAVFVAGDSAGGNLALALIAWVRDQPGLRAPDAVAALSPATDATLASPSLRAHIATDPMLGPMFGPLARVPQVLLLWMGWLQTRLNPRDPAVSPVYGNLSRLPPVLVQASDCEMLHDDARRYVNRARAAGSPVRLQTWAHMVHVWQIFNPELTEARDALDEIGKFLCAAAPVRPQPVPQAAAHA